MIREGPPKYVATLPARCRGAVPVITLGGSEIESKCRVKVSKGPWSN